MVLLGDETQMEARFSPFGENVVSVQDRCTVCAEHTTGEEIILDAHDETAR
jgi:hypothetical protein